MRTDAQRRLRAKRRRLWAIPRQGIWLAFGLCLLVAAANAESDDPPASATPDSASAADSEDAERRAVPSRPPPRPVAAREREKPIFQPSEKIPADVPSDLPTDI